MILTFVRSSSYSAHSLCPMSYFFQYGGLGWKPASNMAADRGSIVHKALETIARAKKAVQDDEKTFTDPELCGGLTLDVGVSDNEALELAWKHYTEGQASHHKWKHSDNDECRRLFNIALTHSNGAYNPRNRTVLQPEQYFDITLPYDWAKYDYVLPDGQRLTGQLALKGTVDLVLEGDRGAIEYADWKTGRRIDWATGKVKTIDDLYEDFQLRLYHLALYELYPDRDTILMTIFFVKDGGPYTMVFEKDEIPKTLERIRSWFELVRSTEVPTRRVGMACNTFCKFGTTPMSQQPFVPGLETQGNTASICDHVYQEVQTLGVDRVLGKYNHNLSKIGQYGSGGGVADREEKKP